MSETAQRPLSRRLQVRVMRTVNVPMRLLLNLPVPTPIGRRLMLLYLTGRKTGREYRQPVSYVRDGQTLLTPGGGNWKLNLAEGRAERIRLRGRDIHATPQIIADIDEIDRLLGVIANSNPTALRFVGIPRDSDGHFDRAPLATAVHHGFRIIRWHPADTAAHDIHYSRSSHARPAHKETPSPTSQPRNGTAACHNFANVAAVRAEYSNHGKMQVSA